MSSLQMQLPSALNKIAVVGTGVIGAGWAALFCAKGYSVVAFVRSKGSQVKFMKALEESYGQLVTRGLASDPHGYKAISCVFNLAECVADADYVQESVVEDMAIKQHIIQEIDHFAPPHVIIGSSTSFIPLSLLQACAKEHPERVAITHPSQPQWQAFCEVLGSSDAVTRWLAQLYGRSLESSKSSIVGLGMDVVPMKREAHGHAFNTFTLSTLMTCGTLVHTGVCDAAACDVALVKFCELVVASGGLGGVMRLVGGGSQQAAIDLSADITMGLPLGKITSWASWVLPRNFLMLFLWLVQLCLWPLRLLKGPVRRANSWFLKPFFDKWDESVAFESTALSRACALEALASDKQKRLASLGGG